MVQKEKIQLETGEKIKARELLEQVREMKIAIRDNIAERAALNHSKGHDQRLWLNSDFYQEYYNKIGSTLAVIEQIRNGNYRDVLIKRYLMAMSINEIAIVRNESYTLVRSRIRKAIKVFEKIYEGQV